MQEEQDAPLTSIKTKIADLDLKILKNPKNHNAYNLKGNYQIDLAKASRNSEYIFKQAEESLTQAVNLSPSNTDYLCDRIELYILIRNFEMAHKDSRILEQLCRDHPGNNISKGFHIKRTQNLLIKLSNVKEEIKSLGDRNKVSQGLLNVITHQTEAIEEVVVANGDNLRKIEELEKNFQLLKTEIGTAFKKLDQVETILDETGAKDKAKAIKDLNDLKSISPNAYRYSVAFYLTLFSLLQAYILLNTGEIASGKSSGPAESILGYFKKAAEVGNEFTQGVPIIGAAITMTSKMIDKVHEWIKKKELENTTCKVKEIIHELCGLSMNNNLEIMVGRVTFVVTGHKKKRMIEQTSSNKVSTKPSLLQKFGNRIIAIWEKKQTEWWSAIQKDGPEVEATKDATELMSYMLLNYKTISRTNKPLHAQIDNALNGDKMNSLFIKLGLGEVCKECKRLFQRRNGKKHHECNECRRISQGGLKCPDCKFKKCEVCARK